MYGNPSWTLIGVVGVIGLALIAALLIFILALGGSTPGPRAVFEAHLTALDAGEWELSDTYTKDECTIAAAGGSEEMLQEVLDGGFSYRRAFEVEDVWINEDGTEAILELDAPSELPPVAVLDLVDGEWLIAC